MSDFLESEAEESDDGELSPSDKKKLKRAKALDSDDEEDEGMRNSGCSFIICLYLR